MAFFYMIKRLRVAVFLSVLGLAVAVGGRELPVPLPSHPGNIFVAGEEVTLAAPPGNGDRWKLMDYEGNGCQEGRFKENRANLGRLKAGYYLLVHEPGDFSSNRVSLGILEPLRAPTPEDSPIGIDVGMAWFFSGSKMTEVANLCALAGMNRVRDRLAWEQMEPKRGEFAPTNHYDEALQAQKAAGLKVLQVSHISASWANPVTKRFPDDLRDSYNFLQKLAERWRGQLEAIEPWNEADIDVFGGHTGSEIASYQKAAYLGLKTGNPGLTACLTPFAIRRGTTLRDFQQNEAWPYYDTYNLHHYEALGHYPALYADHRAVSGGKPMWVSECSVHVKWQGDENLKELTEADARLQGERVTKTYVLGLHQGAAAIFYFMLPHYTERFLQYGVLRADLTPRPAFLAVAAAGRLLAGAKPMGRLDLENDRGQGYFFRAFPDGQASDVMVIWAKEETAFTLPAMPRGAFDHLGRAIALSGNTLKVTSQPLYVLFDKDARLKLKPAPAPAKLLSGKADSVVLQVVVPVEGRSLEKSAYYVPKGSVQEFSLFAYNFGSKRTKGKLSWALPKSWSARMQREVEIEPMGRKEIKLRVTAPADEWSEGRIRINGDFGRGGHAVLSMGFVPK